MRNVRENEIRLSEEGIMTIHSARSTFVSIARIMALLALATSVLSGQDSSKAKSLPTVLQVMDHYVSALGGRDAIFKHKSMTVRGAFELPDKGPALDRIAYYKGGEMLYQVNLPNGGRYQEGYNGTVACRSAPAADPQSQRATR